MRQKSPGKRQIARFCGQLRLLLSAGLPLVQALQIVARTSRGLGLEQAINDINNGRSLARSLSGILPPVIISSLQGAEQAGNIEAVLQRLALYYEAQAELEEKIKSALVYPCFVLFLCFVSLFFLFAFVLPSFRALLLDFNAELPVFTRLLIGAVELINRIWYIPVLGSVCLAIVVMQQRKTVKGAQKIDQTLLRLGLIRKRLVSQLLRSLGELLEGGVPILKALDTVFMSCNNGYLKLIVKEIKLAVEHGQKLSQAMASYQVFNKEMIEMIEVGESSGQFAGMLINVADLSDREREHSLKRFTIMLEPVMTLAVGVMVGMIAVAMFLPLVNMISQMQ